MARALVIFARSLGSDHPETENACDNYAGLLEETGRSPEQIHAQLNDLGGLYGIQFGNP